MYTYIYSAGICIDIDISVYDKLFSVEDTINQV